MTSRHSRDRTTLQCKLTNHPQLVTDSEPTEVYRLKVKVINTERLLLVYDVTSSELYMIEKHIQTLIEIPQCQSKGNHQSLLLQSELRKR